MNIVVHTLLNSQVRWEISWKTRQKHRMSITRFGVLSNSVYLAGGINALTQKLEAPQPKSPKPGVNALRQIRQQPPIEQTKWNRDVCIYGKLGKTWKRVELVFCGIRKIFVRFLESKVTGISFKPF